MLQEMIDSDQQLDGIVRAMFALDSDTARQVAGNFNLRQRLCQKAEADSDAAYKGDQDKLKSIHHALTLIYEREFSMPSPEQTSFNLSGPICDIASIIETFLLDYEEQFIDPAIFDDMPGNGERYITWLRKLIHDHKASNHPFYEEFIHYKANRADLKYYLVQETTLDPRFDDSLAFMQLGTRGQVKMEMANNYWDEMGNGDFRNVHTALFAQALDDLGVTPEYIQENLALGAEISGNLSACMVLYRRHFYKAIGYFGVTEYLVPRRFKH